MPDFAIQVVPVTPFEQNCSLAWSEATKRGVVIDPGGDLPRIREAIAAAGLTIETILLTHGHIDHAAGAAELAAELGVPIDGPHVADKPLLDRLELQGQQYGIAARAVTPDRWLEEGDSVTIGGTDFAVLHCPGHSPGSVVFFSKDLRFAFMGDVLFNGSVGRTDLPGGSHEALIEAIRTKILPLGDDVSFLPGHGPGSTVGHERMTNPFLR
ncbi:MAG TPA: MBL fold metallo-hydrolase [Methylobacterium sp.]|nr:MBL fold metallo-hydrolase [Methylobacterium sp.]